MKKFVHETDGFDSNTVYYQNTDSLYFRIDHCQKLKVANFNRKNLGQGKK